MITVKKIKILPNKSQKETFDFWIRRCCILYNVCLNERKFYYQATGKGLNMYDQKKELVDLKKYDPSWNDVPNKSLQEIVFRVNKAFNSFFEGGGYPKYKNKDTFRSIVFVKQDVRVKNGLTYLPKIKTGIKGIKEFPTNYSSVRLLKEKGDYFLIFTCDIILSFGENYNNDVVGIDLGLSTLMTDSNGYSVNRFSVKLIKKYEQRIKELNKSLSNKKKGSKQREKVKKQLNKAYTKLKNTRLDYLHKQSSKYVKQLKEDIVVVGDLEVKKLMKSNKTKKQKNFSRSYGNSAINIFVNLLEYKVKKIGKEFTKISEEYTSKTCSCCDTVKHDLKVTDRVFNCVNCGLTIPRDENGGINIKRKYMGTFNPIGVKLKNKKTQVTLGQLKLLGSSNHNDVVRLL